MVTGGKGGEFMGRTKDFEFEEYECQCGCGANETFVVLMLKVQYGASGL